MVTGITGMAEDVEVMSKLTISTSPASIWGTPANAAGKQSDDSGGTGKATMTESMMKMTAI